LNLDFKTFTDIDLLLGGSPCQDLSAAKPTGKGLEGSKSILFWRYVDALREVKPKYFLFENVASMKEKDRNIITRELGVQPIKIDSALVSAQRRNRLYWTNIPKVAQPLDKGILLRHILLPNASDSLSHSEAGVRYMDRKVSGGRTHWDFKHHSDSFDDKSATVVANFYKGVPYNVLTEGATIRRFDPRECEKLQTLPIDYTKGVSNTQRYKMIGNGWTVDVIAHILRGMEI